MIEIGEFVPFAGMDKPELEAAGRQLAAIVARPEQQDDLKIRNLPFVVKQFGCGEDKALTAVEGLRNAGLQYLSTNDGSFTSAIIDLDGNCVGTIDIASKAKLRKQREALPPALSYPFGRSRSLDSLVKGHRVSAWSERTGIFLPEHDPNSEDEIALSLVMSRFVELDKPGWTVEPDASFAGRALTRAGFSHYSVYKKGLMEVTDGPPEETEYFDDHRSPWRRPVKSSLYVVNHNKGKEREAEVAQGDAQLLDRLVEVLDSDKR